MTWNGAILAGGGGSIAFVAAQHKDWLFTTGGIVLFVLGTALCVVS